MPGVTFFNPPPPHRPRELLTHCQTLGFEEKPDYTYCRAVLIKAYAQVTGRDEIAGGYEWQNPSKAQAVTPTNFYDLMM